MAVKKKREGWRWLLAIILLITAVTLAEWLVNKHHATEALHKVLFVK